MAERETGQLDAVDGSGVPADGDVATSFLQRAVVRRRVRFLRRRRELALHDLGGFVFESHRLGEPRDELLTEKLAALSALDDELSTLQRALELREEVTVLREPGIASCAHCGAIHDSAANFCPNCGLPAGSAAAPADEASPAQAGPREETPLTTEPNVAPPQQAAPQEPAAEAIAALDEAAPRTDPEVAPPEQAAAGEPAVDAPATLNQAPQQAAPAKPAAAHEAAPAQAPLEATQ